MAIDPLTAATTFATLVSLFSDFLEKRKEVSDDDYQKFLEWLSENRHDEIINSLEQNQATVTSIKTILNLQSSIILNINDKLDNILTADSFNSSLNPLVQKVAPYRALSEQALNILRQFENSNASKIVEIPFLEGTTYQFMDGNFTKLEYNDSRFIEDDFSKLVELRLLKLEFNSRGHKIFKITREASNLLKLI